MEITARTSNSSTILDLNGRLVAGIDVIELRNAVRDATAKQSKKIILNLSNVTYIDSCGIGELVYALKHVKNQGSSLMLSNLPKRVKTLLDIAQLMKVFEVSDSEQASAVNPGQQKPQQQMCY